MLRVLFVSDTHIGFDQPIRPRSDRPRRGPDFEMCFARALEPAHRGEADLVVHGGDLLFRSRVPAALVARALEPLLAVADRDVPVVLVPGNHERSSLPYPLLAAHANVHVFDRPRTVRLQLAGLSVAVSGFPCERDDISGRFSPLLGATGWQTEADVRLLCLHQAVEGASVGPRDFTFRKGPDVLPARFIPAGFAAVLAGHIHRHQVLTEDLAGRRIAAPVVYAGSVERTSFAERNEPKGFVTLELGADGHAGGCMRRLDFRELPARPMLVLDVEGAGLDADTLAARITAALATLPLNAVVQVRLVGPLHEGAERVLRVATLRSLHPASMHVSVQFDHRGTQVATCEEPLTRTLRRS